MFLGFKKIKQKESHKSKIEKCKKKKIEKAVKTVEFGQNRGGLTIHQWVLLKMPKNLRLESFRSIWDSSKQDSTYLCTKNTENNQKHEK